MYVVRLSYLMDVGVRNFDTNFPPYIWLQGQPRHGLLLEWYKVCHSWNILHLAINYHYTLEEIRWMIIYKHSNNVFYYIVYFMSIIMLWSLL